MTAGGGGTPIRGSVDGRKADVGAPFDKQLAPPLGVVGNLHLRRIEQAGIARRVGNGLPSPPIKMLLGFTPRCTNPCV